MEWPVDFKGEPPAFLKQPNPVFLVKVCVLNDVKQLHQAPSPGMAIYGFSTFLCSLF